MRTLSRTLPETAFAQSPHEGRRHPVGVVPLALGHLVGNGGPSAPGHRPASIVGEMGNESATSRKLPQRIDRFIPRLVQDEPERVLPSNPVVDGKIGERHQNVGHDFQRHPPVGPDVPTVRRLAEAGELSRVEPAMAKRVTYGVGLLDMLLFAQQRLESLPRRQIPADKSQVRISGIRRCGKGTPGTVPDDGRRT